MYFIYQLYVCMQGLVEDQINQSEQATLLKYILNKKLNKNKINKS